MDAEARIRRDLLRITRVVLGTFDGRLRLCALVGGYARGEGAIERHGQEVLAHNDYDLLVVIQNPEEADRFRAKRAGLLARNEVGVEVDVAVVAERVFLNPPPTLFWLDVTLGGIRWLGGDPGLLTQQRSVEPRAVPLDEGGRLLANRAVGLALSRLGGEFSEEPVVMRHGHKAVLGAGDALLLALGCYGGTALERSAELARFAGAPSLGPWLAGAYREALRFREDAAGWRPPQGTVAEWFERVCREVGAFHGGFEAWRVGAPAGPLPLASWGRRLFRWKPDARLGDLGAGLRAWFRGLAPLGLPPLLHPRERLARAAIAVAYGGEAGEQEAGRLLGLAPGAPRSELQRGLLRLRAVGS